MRRRALLFGSVGLWLGGCRRPSERASLPAGWHRLDFEAEAQRALVLTPPRPGAPLCVALHGRGEAGRGLEVGAAAWPEEYALARMIQRAFAPPLTGDDLQGMFSPERLAQINASLAAAPYTGMALACPYTPDLADRSPEGAAPFGRFVLEKLLPRARSESRASAAREATGIDGVSMGGRLALFVGLAHPEVFGVVGALQPALRVDEAKRIAELAVAANARAPIKLRLVSSDEDVFLPAVRAASEALRAAGVAHELLVVPGTHGYAFNRGPGGAELLLWHERVQRGLPPP